MGYTAPLEATGPLKQIVSRGAFRPDRATRNFMALGEQPFPALVSCLLRQIRQASRPSAGCRSYRPAPAGLIRGTALPDDKEETRPSPRRGTDSVQTDRDTGAALRSIYQKTIDEKVPDEMLDLLGKLD